MVWGGCASGDWGCCVKEKRKGRCDGGANFVGVATLAITRRVVGLGGFKGLVCWAKVPSEGAGRLWWRVRVENKLEGVLFI